MSDSESIDFQILAELRRITQNDNLSLKILRKERESPRYRCNLGALRLDGPEVILGNWNIPAIIPTYLGARRNLIFEYDETPMLLETLRKIVHHATSLELPTWGHKKVTDQSNSIMIESSSPNIAKPFHMGHLRSTILGQFLCNLYRAQGYQVRSVNYLGDWGKQYGLLAIAWSRWGDEEKLQADPIHHLYDLYVRINKEITAEQDWDPQAPSKVNDAAKAYFSEMERGDTEKLALWRRFRDMSLTSLKKTYARLGISYDIYSGEARAARDPESEEVVEALHRAGVLGSTASGPWNSFRVQEEKRDQEQQRDDGRDQDQSLSVQFDLSPYEGDQKLQAAPLCKSDGSSLYLTRDLGEIFWRDMNYRSDKYLYIVGEGQSLHFRQFFATVRILDPPLADRCEHIGFGLVNGMATRQGNAVFLNDVLDEAQSRIFKKMQSNPEKYENVEDPEHTADLLGQSAVIIQDLLGNRSRNYNFDWDRSCASKGFTGPYLQYAHARICNIFKKVGLDIHVPPPQTEQILGDPETIKKMWINDSQQSTSSSESWRSLLRTLMSYPHVLDSCLKSNEASPLVDFLMRLSKHISEVYRDLPVKTYLEDTLEENTLQMGYRNALLFWAARQLLAGGMELLGLRPIESM